MVNFRCVTAARFTVTRIILQLQNGFSLKRAKEHVVVVVVVVARVDRVTAGGLGLGRLYIE